MERHPDYLEWMIIALERRSEQWHLALPSLCGAGHVGGFGLVPRGVDAPTRASTCRLTQEPPLQSRAERRI